MSVQKKALSHFKASGNFQGFQDRTVDALLRKGHIKRTEAGMQITKRGEALLAGRLGGNLGDRFTMKRDRRTAVSKARSGKAKKGYWKPTKAELEANDMARRQEVEKHAAKEGRMLGKILGPSGVAHAVKITRTDGQPFTVGDAEAFESAGWGVMAASSVAGKAGSGLPGSYFVEGDWVYSNPSDLGPRGVARGLVIAGKVDRGVVDELRDQGYDVSPAPKKLREAIRNPSKGKPGALDGIAKKLYDLVLSNTKKGQAWNGEELAKKLGVAFSDVDHVLLDLAGRGLIHSPGADMFGSTWLAGAPTPALFSNPSRFDREEAQAAKRSKKAAERWYGEPELVNATKILRGHEFPEAFLDAGRITAIEYESDKFDGETRLYRHEVTKKRRLIISADGSTILIHPPFRVTKRGIEG
jgi:hypothetical protein